MRRLKCVLKVMPAVALSLAVAVVAVKAGGQTTFPDTPRQPPSMLALLRMNASSWNTAHDGVLVAVDPQRAASVPVGDAPGPVDGGAGLSEADTSLLAEAVQGFRCEAGRFGQVTVLAPTKMVVLNPYLAAPNLYAGLSPAEKMRLLIASLSPEQWRQISSPHGLGADDLSGDLSHLFLSILPDPFKLDTATAQEDHTVKDEDALTLTPDDRVQVRLRLSLATSVQPVPAQPGVGVLLIGGPIRHRPGTSFLVLAPTFDKPASSDSYGVALRAEAPNRIKDGQLDFNAPALTAYVSLQPEVTGQFGAGDELTVGALVHRTGLAAHMELYADRRVASLPVWVHGGAAPARDLLQALCLGVTGAFRRVGPAYILTDDVSGIGARYATVADWLQDAAAQRDALMTAARSANVPEAVLSSLSLPPDDPLAQDSTTVSKIIQQSGTSYSGAGYQTALTSLSAAARPVISRYLQDALQQSQPVRTDKVSLDLELRLSYIVPGAGDVTDEQLDMGSLASLVQTPPPDDNAPVQRVKADPAELRNCSLYVTLDNSEQATRVVNAAKGAGIKQLWVRTEAGGDLSALTAAIAAGRKAGLPVLAGISLLSLPSDASKADLNVQGISAAEYRATRQKAPAGQSAPWSIPSPSEGGRGNWAQPIYSSLLDPETRLTALARLSGLGGIILEDTATPGYERPGERDNSGAGPWTPFVFHPAVAATDMGYTEQNRLQFLRTYGVDPVDLVTSTLLSTVNLDLPFFPPASQEESQWVTFRYRQGQGCMAGLFDSLKKTNPNLPLLIGERSLGERWIGSWDKATSLPVCGLDSPDSTWPQQARVYSSQTYLRIPITDDGIGRVILNQIAKASLPSNTPAPWNGVVLDATRLTTNKLLEILNPL